MYFLKHTPLDYSIFLPESWFFAWKLTLFFVSHPDTIYLYTYVLYKESQIDEGISKNMAKVEPCLSGRAGKGASLVGIHAHLRGFESSSRRQDFSSKNYHYKSIYIYLRGMWWHDDVLNHYIRNCLTISSIMMDVRNSHGSGECRNNTLNGK